MTPKPAQLLQNKRKLKDVVKLCAYFFLYIVLGITLKRRDCGLVNCFLMLLGRIIKTQLSVCLDTEGLVNCLYCLGLAPERNTSLYQVETVYGKSLLRLHFYHESAP